MDERIYSRHRFSLHKIKLDINKKTNNNNNNYSYNYNKKIISRRFFVIVIIILIIAYSTAVSIINTINPSLERQSRVLARATAEKLSNYACQEVMQNVNYEDLCEIEKDKDGNIKLVNLDVINVNKVSSKIALKVQENLNYDNNNIISISFGSVTGNKILAGKGPIIKVRVETIGDIQTSVKSEFSSAGINQTLHKIYLNLECHMSIISPYKDTDEIITTEVLLAESVIMGEIPQTYYNLEGIQKEDTLNMIN